MRDSILMPLHAGIWKPVHNAPEYRWYYLQTNWFVGNLLLMIQIGRYRKHLYNIPVHLHPYLHSMSAFVASQVLKQFCLEKGVWRSLKKRSLIFEELARCNKNPRKAVVLYSTIHILDAEATPKTTSSSLPSSRKITFFARATSHFLTA